MILCSSSIQIILHSLLIISLGGKKKLKDGDAMIEAEWNAVAEARKALDEAEFRAKQMEEVRAFQPFSF